VTEAVLDASAVLALLLREPGAASLEHLLERSVLSAVNLTEVQTKLIDLGPQFVELRTSALSLPKRIEEFTAQQAQVAAGLRTVTRSAGLSLGDRACLALAMSLDAEVYTADKAWKNLDIGCTIHIIR
jgi:PIN domain nuclease of toxin-antitoxin system